MCYEGVWHYGEHPNKKSSSKAWGQHHGLCQGLSQWLCSYGVSCDQCMGAWGKIIIY